MTSEHLTAGATIRMNHRPPATRLGDAFCDAVEEFTKKYGREPDLDLVMFRGVFTTGKITIEIKEIP